MIPLFTIAIEAPTNPMDRRSQELAYIQRAISLAMAEFGRNHHVAGDIIGQANDGTPNSSLGSWSYHPVAKEP